MLLMLADTFGFIFSFPVSSVLCVEGLAAMAIGAVRAMVVGVDMV